MDKRLSHLIEEYKKIRNMNNLFETRWLIRFLELLAFKKEYGHTDVPVRYEKNQSLAYWIRRQRHLHDTKKMDTMREDLLKLAGFRFRILPRHDWEKMFRELIRFREEHGHAHITESHENRKLYDWLVYQRKLSWQGKLSNEKLVRLKSLGVDMRNKTSGYWEKMYNELVRFKEQHNHLYVCKYYGADKQLVNFVKVNRKNKNKMPQERRRKLDDIGFIWKPGKEVTKRMNKERADEVWIVHYEELKVYKRKFGTCRVPAKSMEYPTLGDWVSRQRSKKENLPKAKLRLLKKIGFWQGNEI